MTESKSGSFEASLSRLEAIVKELDGESVDLERSVELFKEGRTLVKRCEDLLKHAEETLKAADGIAVQPPADDDAAGDDAPF